MSPEDGLPQLDPGMLELFCSDVESRKAGLFRYVAALVENPGATDSAESAIREVEAIKGTALLVELDEAARIAEALEEGLLAVKRGELLPGPEYMDLVKRAVNCLEGMARAALAASEGKSASAPEESTEEMVATIRSMTPNGHHEAPPPAETFVEAPSALVEGAAELFEAPCAVPPEMPGPSETPALAAPVAPPKAPPAAAPVSTPAPAPKPPAPSGSLPSSMIDASMLELFQEEAATHTAALTDGLLSLEANPNAAEAFESLMRAAHSVKGSARILGLDHVVRLAHTMEDCFVLAQKGQLTFDSPQVDLLLKATDLLAGLASGGDPAAWQAEKESDLDAFARVLEGFPSGGGVPEDLVLGAVPSADGPAAVDDSETADAEEPADAHEVNEAEETCDESAESESAPELSRAGAAPPPPCGKEPAAKRGGAGGGKQDRTLRVTAGKIERLIGLAGEVVVNAQRLSIFRDSFGFFKRNLQELGRSLEDFNELILQGADAATLRGAVRQARAKVKDSSRQLAERLNHLDLFSTGAATLSERLYHEVVGVRMRPFVDAVRGFPRMVRDLGRQLGKKVVLEIVGESTEVDRDILEKMDAPLNHMIRNAVDHGIEAPEERIAAGKPETGTLRLQAEHRSGMLMIRLSDDGRGVNMARLRQRVLDRGLASQEIVDRLSEPELLDFLFLPGFSTSRNVTEISGRGVGLDVVRNAMREVGGVVRVTSKAGEGMAFHLELPLTLSVLRTFLVEIDGEPYAFPLTRIDRCLMVAPETVRRVEDRQYFEVDGRNIALVNIHHVLALKEPGARIGDLSVVMVSDRLDGYGLVVDRFLGECDLVVRPLDPRLGKVPDVSAAALLEDNSPVLIFDVEDLLRSINNILSGERLKQVAGVEDRSLEAAGKRVLVVDDSITVRELERKMLENRGYRVEVAVDGMDGWNAVRSGKFDLVITDVDMPRMNGIELVGNIRNHSGLKEVPIVIVSYKDREEDRLQGLNAGANYYLTKSNFQDNSFMDAVVDLIGEGLPDAHRHRE